MWDALIERYKHRIPGYTPSLNPFKNWPLLWEQEAQIPFEPWELNVLRATYDRAVINGLTNLSRIADNLQRFEKEHHLPWKGISHLASIGLTVETLLRSMGGVWAPTAIGFQATSGDMWCVQDEKGDDSRPYSLLIDDLHHQVELVPNVFGH